MARNRGFLQLLIAACLAPSLALAQPGLLKSQPVLKARLLAAHDFLVMGGQTELAIELTIPAHQHIYHPILLETGLPTEIDLTLPPGVTAAPLRFPTPTYGESAGVSYLAYEDRAVILTTLTADNSFKPGDTLEIVAKVNGLFCEDNGSCVPVSAEANLDLRLAAVVGTPINTDVFEQARAALPKPLADAPQLNGSLLLPAHTKIPVGGRSELVLILNVQDGYHIQDRNPGPEGFIPTRVFLEKSAGVELDLQAQHWPTPETIDVPGVGKVRQQAGRVAIRTPMKIADDDVEPGTITLRALVEYQACKEQGVCLLPETAEATVSFEIVPADQPAVANTDPALSELPADTGIHMPLTDILVIFGMAFLGGVILNIMPCVLPVISLKVFSFVQQSRESRGHIFALGLTYGAGIMASFVVIGIVMVNLGLAWGGLMQSPSFTIGLCGLVVAFALSLLGVYEIRLPGAAMNAASAAGSKEGYAGAFMNGLLATALATPCVGPFLGPALGLMLNLPPTLMFFGILTVGLGLALPYVLLTAFPAWLKYLPKPGVWMVTFKQAMGLVMFAVVIWLLSILSKQVSAAELLGALAFLFAISVSCWLIGRISLSATMRKAGIIWIAAIAVTTLGWTHGRTAFGGSANIPWQEWHPGVGPDLAKADYTVYVDYTAEWCLTCQWNKRVVLETSKIAAALEERGVRPIHADFTKFDPQMLAEIREFGRNGVPLNVVYPAGRPDEPIVLPELLTQSAVLEALEKAGPSTAKPDSEAPPGP